MFDSIVHYRSKWFFPQNHNMNSSWYGIEKRPPHHFKKVHWSNCGWIQKMKKQPAKRELKVRFRNEQKRSIYSRRLRMNGDFFSGGGSRSTELSSTVTLNRLRNGTKRNSRTVSHQKFLLLCNAIIKVTNAQYLTWSSTRT